MNAMTLTRLTAARTVRSVGLRDADTGKVRDHENPAFLFSTTSNALLRGVASGDIDAQAHAALELENRRVQATVVVDVDPREALLAECREVVREAVRLNAATYETEDNLDWKRGESDAALQGILARLDGAS